MSTESQTPALDPTDALLARVGVAIATVMVFAIWGAHWWSYGRPVVRAEDAHIGGAAAVSAVQATGQEQAISAAAPPSGPWVDATFGEYQHHRLHAGQIAEVRAKSDPGRVFTGHITALAAPETFHDQVWQAGRQFHARVSLDAGDADLRLLQTSMPVSVAVDTKSR